MRFSVQTPRKGFSMTVLKCHAIKTKKYSYTKNPYLVQLKKQQKTLENVGLEPGTKAFRVKRSTAEPKIRATKKTLEGGDNAPSPETVRLP